LLGDFATVSRLLGAELARGDQKPRTIERSPVRAFSMRSPVLEPTGVLDAAILEAADLPNP